MLLNTIYISIYIYIMYLFFQYLCFEACTQPVNPFPPHIKELHVSAK